MNQLSLFPIRLEARWSMERYPKYVLFIKGHEIPLTHEEMDELKGLVYPIRTGYPPEEGDLLANGGEVDYDFIVAWDEEFLPGGHNKRSYFQGDEDEV